MPPLPGRWQIRWPDASDRELLFVGADRYVPGVAGVFVRGDCEAYPVSEFTGDAVG